MLHCVAACCSVLQCVSHRAPPSPLQPKGSSSCWRDASIGFSVLFSAMSSLRGFYRNLTIKPENRTRRLYQVVKVLFQFVQYVTPEIQLLSSLNLNISKNVSFGESQTHFLLTDADASRPWRQVHSTKRKTTRVTKYERDLDVHISKSSRWFQSPKYHKFRPCHPDLFFAEVNLQKNTLKFSKEKRYRRLVLSLSLSVSLSLSLSVSLSLDTGVCMDRN